MKSPSARTRKPEPKRSTFGALRGLDHQLAPAPRPGYSPIRRFSSSTIARRRLAGVHPQLDHAEVGGCLERHDLDRHQLDLALRLALDAALDQHDAVRHQHLASGLPASWRTPSPRSRRWCRRARRTPSVALAWSRAGDRGDHPAHRHHLAVAQRPGTARSGASDPPRELVARRRPAGGWRRTARAPPSRAAAARRDPTRRRHRRMATRAVARRRSPPSPPRSKIEPCAPSARPPAASGRTQRLLQHLGHAAAGGAGASRARRRRSGSPACAC